MPFQSTKTFGHNLGISACFRQPLADSHCRFLHGYPLAFKLTFECERLDYRNWCMDFGGLKEIKQLLVDTFDHKTIVDTADPELMFFRDMHQRGIIQLVTMEGVGCERFAWWTYNQVSLWLLSKYPDNRVCLVSAEVSEHGANSAIYRGK